MEIIQVKGKIGWFSCRVLLRGWLFFLSTGVSEVGAFNRKATEGKFWRGPKRLTSGQRGPIAADEAVPWRFHSNYKAEWLSVAGMEGLSEATGQPIPPKHRSVIVWIDDIASLYLEKASISSRLYPFFF